MKGVGVDPAQLIAVSMQSHDDFDEWRDHARALLRAGVAPERSVWTEPGRSGDLLAQAQVALLPGAMDVPLFTISRGFLDVARNVVCHSDPERFALLYRVLWRCQQRPRLMEGRADVDVRRLELLARDVRRDIHKMRAFVRFRTVGEGADERYVAWFEPSHHIVRANARFFTDRFATMRWSILTPEISIHWDGVTLLEGSGACKQDAPQDDATEEMWKLYYTAIFNPARLKVKAMTKEMPRRYWKNMPETAMIASLIAGARGREAAMVEKAKDDFAAENPVTLQDIANGIDACRYCPIGCNGTRAVAGEGAANGRIMFVGEQPGDQEERTGRPFIGPAGQLLDHHLERAGIDRTDAYITNAVKHFKFAPRGKQRIHQTPTAGEIDKCRFWLDAERRILKPRIIVALGASAARAILGRTPSIQRERGRAIMLPDGATLWITVHPSYLLRIPDEMRERESRAFAEDLNVVARALK